MPSLKVSSILIAKWKVMYMIDKEKFVYAFLRLAESLPDENC